MTTSQHSHKLVIIPNLQCSSSNNPTGVTNIIHTVNFMNVLRQQSVVDLTTAVIRPYATVILTNTLSIRTSVKGPNTLSTGLSPSLSSTVNLDNASTQASSTTQDQLI